MTSTGRRGWLFAPMMLAVAILFTAVPTGALAAGIQECLDCHDNVTDVDYMKSAHQELTCTGCHSWVTDLEKHGNGELTKKPVVCERCHRDVAAKYAGSVHGEGNASCTDCHQAIHTTVKKVGKVVMSKVCDECHDTGFADSEHGKGLYAENDLDHPGCTDCHDPHAQKAMDPKSIEVRMMMVTSCIRCHEDTAMMSKHGVEADYVGCYDESYHGKRFNLGDCEKSATCVDCHTAHKVMPSDNPLSSVNTANLTTTCSKEGTCHPAASPLFAKYVPHGSHKDKENYPIFYWTFVIMTLLLVGVFGFFWLHTLLWWQRAFRENRQIRAHHVEHTVPAELTGEVYRRFDFFAISMHFIMVVSFLALVFTGLPLKFPHSFWAKFIMDAWGGPANAGLVHRLSALLTFFYFVSVNIKVWYFLLFKKTGKTFFQKFFGPESLFPNFQDARDIVGMFKWFFGMGPKPSFGRWTYWEKFDFLAVYWGMFAIGLTGLMLWFPEWWGKFTPGWLFNVATIMHSDEALLAAGFIFTVHFFNTHWRPEKFPMDLVIFTGKVSRHEMAEERPLQIPVEKEKGTLKQMETGYASSLAEFVAQIVGYTALALGVLGTVLIVTGFLG